MNKLATPRVFCPIPAYSTSGTVSLAHGEGGLLSRQLITRTIHKRLGTVVREDLGDSALLGVATGRLVMTTDSFVVTPLFFPGGDIGKLAVFGTVNDLAVAGAIPRWLSLGIIAEEGLELSILERVLDSIASAAESAGVEIVTGDTKVTPKGAVDKLFLHTTGIGEIIDPAPSGPSTIIPGDVLLVSGPIARHGIAVLCARENLGFSPEPTSDCASLVEAIAALRGAGIKVRAMRDATRGGLSAVLHEWAEQCNGTFVLEERMIPVTQQVRGACELLGLDPAYVACEGTMVVAIDAQDAEAAVAALRSVEVSFDAARIGTVIEKKSAPVVVRRGSGSEVPLDEPMGAPMPRIC